MQNSEHDVVVKEMLGYTSFFFMIDMLLNFGGREDSICPCIQTVYTLLLFFKKACLGSGEQVVGVHA